MTKVLDTLLFTHEFDLLELRLRTLWPVVDKFLVLESDYNFVNKWKRLRLGGQKDRFEWAKDKLFHAVHRGPFKEYDAEADIHAYGGGELFIEHQHRQCLYDTAKKLEGFGAQDIMMISDVDEIPSREVVEKLKKDRFQAPILCHQDFYYYNIKCHRGRRWHGTIFTRFGDDIHSIARLRSKRNNMDHIDSECGWHFAHFYDAEGIKEKLKHSSHQHYNMPEYYDPDHIAMCIAENKSYIKKKEAAPVSKPEPIPSYMMEELKRFPLMLGEVAA